MIVKLTYFKIRSEECDHGGEYYGEGEYSTEESESYKIIAEVRAKLYDRKLPGLFPGHSSFYVHVLLPEHSPPVHQLVIPHQVYSNVSLCQTCRRVMNLDKIIGKLTLEIDDRGTCYRCGQEWSIKFFSR